MLKERRLQVRVDGDQGQAIIEAHGEVDCATASALGTILQAFAQQPDHCVVLDLRATTYFDSSGISTLMGVQSRLASCLSFEVQVCAGSQPEAILREAEAHRLFSVVVWGLPTEPHLVEQPGMVQGSLELRLPSDVFQVGRVRHLIEEVLILTGMDEGAIGDFVTAVGEAVANAVTHGSPKDSPGYVIFSLRPGPSTVTAEVQDFGHGIDGWTGQPKMPPPQSLRGRGMGMMKVFADSLEVQTGSGGTLVRLRKCLEPQHAM